MADVNLQFQKYTFQQKEEGLYRGINRHAYETDYNFFSPRMGINYNINEQLNIFGNISLAHREPTDDDLFDIWQGPDDLGVAPLFANVDTVKTKSGEIDYLNWSDPQTESEQLLDFELGAGYHGKILNVKINGYWMDFKNEIVPYSQVDKDGFPIKGNAERTIHRGVEGSFGIKLSNNLELSGAAALSQNYFDKFVQYEAQYDENWNFTGNKEIDFHNKTIAGFPGTMANLKLKYTYGSLNADLFLQHVGKQYLDNNEMEKRSISAFTLLNLHLAYHMSNKFGLGGIKISVWLNNLLDLTYETAGYYDSWEGENFLWPGAKRNFFVGLETSL